MNCEFSIIIPVYNIQEYIYDCLNSIKKQTYTNYEVIIVNDGSTDNSAAVCEQFSYNDKRFITYNKKNGGLSDARNYGVKKANGRYLIFVDGDDYVSSSMLEEFYKVISEVPNVDIVLEEGQYFDETGNISYEKRFRSEKFGIKNGKQAMKYLLKGKSLWAAFGKCYNRNFWMKYNFEYLKGITSEDFELIYKVIYRANKIVMRKGASYYYRVSRKGSIIESFNINNILDVFHIIERWEKFFAEEKINILIKFGMRKKFGDMVRFYILRQMPALSNEQRILLNDIIKKYLCYLKYGNNIWLYFLIKIKGTDYLISLYDFFNLRFKRKKYEGISK